ncbi:MAG: nucleotidyltransferase family protein [Sulfuricaulis sp.]
MNAKVSIDSDSIARFCRRWKITELSLFGSVLRADFRPDSDVDVLVSFAPEAEWSLLDHAAMQQELSALLDRPVDLVSRRAIERSGNWIRRENILSTAEPVYVAR